MDDIRAGYRDAEQETDDAVGGGDLGGSGDVRDLRGDSGNIGEQVGHDPGNLGDDVTGTGDITFPDAPIGEHSM